ncbi:uncharacterized protein LOC129299549 [Prosopis cineraria]|uniref:uncharacterized protein LOC129299549 n=1 Tax=Prosopis cineraria TaxID=364024 RepID=UPI0024109FB8|nr:uncharacterized protein LOC129299549 [Prosopis cineraria]
MVASWRVRKLRRRKMKSGTGDKTGGGSRERMRGQRSLRVAADSIESLNTITQQSSFRFSYCGSNELFMVCLTTRVSFWNLFVTATTAELHSLLNKSSSHFRFHTEAGQEMENRARLRVHKTKGFKSGKKKHLVKRVVDYLKSDTFLYAPLLSSVPPDFRSLDTLHSSDRVVEFKKPVIENKPFLEELGIM